MFALYNGLVNFRMGMSVFYPIKQSLVPTCRPRKDGGLCSPEQDLNQDSRLRKQAADGISTDDATGAQNLR